MNTIKKLIFMRGLPGSGKSTIARRMVKEWQGSTAIVFSADGFLYVNNEYVWTIERLKEAHRLCQESVWNAINDEDLCNDFDLIIVDNTNITLKELKAYKEHIKRALELGFVVDILETDPDLEIPTSELEKRNSHSVSRETIENRARKYKKNITIEDILGIENH